MLTIDGRKPRRLIATLLLSLTLPAIATEPKINGELDQIGSIRALHVWGTPQQMGFAQGYLVGDEFIKLQQEMLAPLPQQQRAVVIAAQSQLVQFIEITDRTRMELEGMLEGMKAKNGGKLPTIKALGRPVNLEDLILYNAKDMTRAFGCSGYTLWGDKAGKHGVMTTRNFDFWILAPSMVESQLLIVRQPENRRSVATIAWPCFVGGLTGINDAGVCTFMHDGSGGISRAPTRRCMPLALALTEVLETTDASKAPKSVQKIMQKNSPYPFSYMVRVVTPRVRLAEHIPAHVFRIDPSGNVTENPSKNGTCVTTNHYIDQDGKPAQNAYQGTLARHKKLADRVKSGSALKDPWEALKSVGDSGTGSVTLHAVVVYPEKRRLELSFAKRSGKVIEATEIKPITIEFDNLLAPRPGN